MDATRQLILRAQIDFPSDFGDEPKEVIVNLVQHEPDNRSDLEEVLKSKWLSSK